MRSTFATSKCIATTSIALLIASAGGCASTARQVAGAASPVVVHSGLTEANTPDNQQQMQRLADSSAVQHAGQNLGEGVAIGLYNEANKLVGDQSTGATTGPTTSPTSQAASGNAAGSAALAGLAGGRGGLNGFVKSSVQEAFLAATDPQFKAGEQAMSEAIGEGFVTGMITVLNKEGPAIGDTIHKQVGPIMQDLIREQVAPAVRDMLQQQLAPAALQVWREGAVETLKLTVRPDLQNDVEQNAQNASLGATRGTHLALVESGVLSPSGELSPHLKIYLWIVCVVMGFILAAGLWLLLILNFLALHHWRRRLK